VARRSDKQSVKDCLLDREAASSRSFKEHEEQKMKKVNWTTVVIFTIVALLVLQLAGYLLGGSRYGGWGMMGPGGMMGGWGYSPFDWIGMTFMWLIPVGFLVLTVLGVAWLVRNLGNTTPASLSACSNCGKGVQADWKICPYCGTALK